MPGVSLSSFPFSLSCELKLAAFLKGKNKVRRVKTIYDCQADNDDELTFKEGEVIVVTGEEDQEWWVCTSRVALSVVSPHTRHEGTVPGLPPGQEL